MVLLNRKQVAARTALSISTLRRLEEAGDFPCRVRITDSRVAWISDEIDQWIESRARQRDLIPAG